MVINRRADQAHWAGLSHSDIQNTNTQTDKYQIQIHKLPNTKYHTIVYTFQAHVIGYRPCSEFLRPNAKTTSKYWNTQFLCPVCHKKSGSLLLVLLYCICQILSTKFSQGFWEYFWLPKIQCLPNPFGFCDFFNFQKCFDFNENFQTSQKLTFIGKFCFSSVQK